MSDLIKRSEAERLTYEEVKEIALDEVEYNGFKAVIYKCFNGYSEELNSNIYYFCKYIDYITYPDYVVNIHGDLAAYKKYVSKQLRIKCFSAKQLESVKNYADFSNKNDFIYNILPQLFDSVSIFNMKQGEDKVYKYKACLTHYYKNKADADYVQNVHDCLHNLYDDMMKDPVKFREAVLREFYNHETPIDWDGMTPALNALGIRFNNLSNEFKAIVIDAYNECCNSHDW